MKKCLLLLVFVTPGGNVVNASSVSYTVTVNGSYTFAIRDNAGNQTNLTVFVGNIDRAKPVVRIEEKTKTDESATANVFIQDVGEKK